MVECQSCGGIGTEPLHDELWLTLKSIRSGAVAQEILERLSDKISVNAVNNRLERLRKLELVERNREGKFWRYRLK